LEREVGDQGKNGSRRGNEEKRESWERQEDCTEAKSKAGKEKEKIESLKRKEGKKGNVRRGSGEDKVRRWRGGDRVGNKEGKISGNRRFFCGGELI